ncbi:MAG: hypothetical protein A2V72_01940 [Candidatus Nealsonbacteria bacterium RBG_13_37_56]|uniref:Coenzyme F420 hydrogenase/dehydrogenase beta subunit C-terminal domain-containing protein n=1 Tax=Candidatus Nealsonbacteria bacterium RBG_13_37_56 TaxID=1801661 RepID=A0A1G2DWM2_9BACT|nr:MAG: hypothetical protein A2V72_01940 [Candidatus Nealsonbacteria bacterium RBG_13_37_56]
MNEKIYIGYALDQNIRSQCSSGGVATALIKYLIEKGRIKGAWLAKYEKNLKHKMYFVNKAEDVIKYRGSVYCPVDFSPVWQFINNNDEKVAIVGLPCNFRALGDRPGIFKIGLFCGGVTDIRVLEYLTMRKKIKPEDVLNLGYREGGWLNRKIVATLKNKKEVLLEKKASFFSRCLANFCFGGSSFLNSCNLCRDHRASQADIALGDAWLPEIMNKDSIGTNLIIVRTEKGAQLLNQAVRDRVIKLFLVGPDDLARSQGKIQVKRFFQFMNKHFPFKFVFALYCFYYPMSKIWEKIRKY